MLETVVDDDVDVVEGVVAAVVVEGVADGEELGGFPICTSVSSFPSERSKTSFVTIFLLGIIPNICLCVGQYLHPVCLCFVRKRGERTKEKKEERKSRPAVSVGFDGDEGRAWFG